MPSSSSATPMPEQAIDITRKHREIIAEIAARLLRKEYQYYHLWQSIIDYHKSLQWTLDDSGDIQESIKTVITECEQRIERGCSYAMALRAIMHREGFGGKKDYVLAIKLLEQAIELDDSFARSERAFMLTNGIGGEKDVARAEILLEQASAAGLGNVLYQLAYRHQFGLGCQKDLARAGILYEQAIALHSVGARHQLAFMLWQQDDISNHARAIKLFEQAAALGFAPAIRKGADTFVFNRR